MNDEQPKKRPLSEISHLFLSSVRDRQTGGSLRPQRMPPGGSRPAPRPDETGSSTRQPEPSRTIDLTPEEFAQVFGAIDADGERPAGRKAAPVSAVLGAHLNGRQFDRVKEYARHLAARGAGRRVGLIELDASEFRLMCFEPGQPSAGP